MKLLLDTHALLWVLIDSPRLSSRAREAVGSDRNEKILSAVSAIELTTKFRRGKLDEATPFVEDGRLMLDDLEHTPLPITIEHAALAGSLDVPHKDPFDRLLVAQSLIEQIPLVSNEKLFDSFGVERIW